MRPTILCSTLLACATACPADSELATADTLTSSTSSDASTAEADATGSTDADPGSTGEAPTTSEAPGTDATGDTTDTGAPESVCGDGVLDDGEVCDDGNDAPEDGCEACMPVPHVDWSVQIAGEAGDHDRALDVAITPDGTIVVVGYQDGTSQVRRPVVIALAPDGSVLSKYVHPTPHDHGIYESIVVAADGSYYVAGSITLDPGSATSAALHKFSADHTLAWTHEQPAPTKVNAFARAVALADDALYTGGVEHSAPSRMFVRRHALATGKIEWEWNGPDPAAPTRARGVAVAGGRVIVVGSWELGGEDYPLAAALDPQGNQIRQVSSSAPGELTDVEAIGEDVVISGWQVPLDHAPLLWRTDSDFGTVWSDLPGTLGELHGVAADPTRGVVVTGLVGTAEYDADIHVGLHSDAGVQLWTDVTTGVKPDGDDRGEDLAFGPHSFVAVGGVAGPDGSYDLWIRRVLFG